MRIRCVVPATDSPAGLERCLGAIRESERSPDELVWVTEPANSGPAAARNAGASDGDGEVIAFVDADVVVHPDAFSRIEAALEAEPGLDAIFGAYDDAPAAPDAVSGFRNLLHHRVHVEGAGDAETFWAGLGAIRREAFDAVGGFDAGRFPNPSVEDIDLGMRLVANGRRIRLDPSIQGTHLKRWTVTEMVRVDFGRRGIPWARLLLESGRASGTLNLAPRHLIGVAASVITLAGLITRRPRALGLGAAVLIWSNVGLYALIWRRRGAGQAVAAVGLHVLHHLTGLAAGTAALAQHLARAREPS